MKPSRIFSIFIFLSFVMMSGNYVPLNAQENDDCQPTLLSKGAARDAVSVISSNYYNWDKLSIDGKLRSDMIPMGISPSIKIFMEKDKKIQMSLRAPFVGEVGQLEITTDSVKVINKFSKTYAMADLKKELPAMPLTLGEIQSAILGRIIVPGNGELSKKNMSKAEISLDCEGGWLVYPDESLLPEEVSIGYITYSDGKLQGTMIENVSSQGVDESDNNGSDSLSETSDMNDMLSMLYSWDDRKCTIEMEAHLKGKVLNGILSLDNPVQKSSEIKIRIPDNYRRVGFSRILGKAK